jgi:MoaA/NifB/PqqE/SkfB family radical SAM enzyme
MIKAVSCTYWRTQSDDAISTLRAQQLMHETAAAGFKYLRILGGEPLLRKDLFDILDEIPRQSFSKVILATNGLLLHQHADAVNRSCITNITVSLDGIAETNDQLRGLKGYFQTVLRNLELIEGKRIKIASIATKYLANEIGDMIRLCRERGYDYDICLPNRALPFSSTDDELDDLWPSPQDGDRIFGAMAREGLVSAAVAKGSRRFLRDNSYPVSTCVLGYVHTLIRANGDLYIGCHDLEPVGNVLDSSLAEILASDRAAETARRMFRLDYPKCICNWQIDQVYSSPLSALSYVQKRLSTRPLPLPVRQSSHD